MSSDADERVRRLAIVVQAAGGPDPVGGICRAGAVALGVPGVGLMVMGEGPPSPLAWSDPVSARLEELQQTFGEGPCVDAHRSGGWVSEPELARPLRPRWAAFAPAALDAGAAAVFSLPLRLGGVRLGALTVHRAVSGELSDEQYADALAVAATAVTAILVSQSEAPAGALGPGLEPLVVYSATLHQASGMVSVQLGIRVGEALACLRAYAFSSARPLAEVAVDVVARRLRLDE